jgi:hypothetical protein
MASMASTTAIGSTSGAECFSCFIVPGGMLSVGNANEFNRNSLLKPLQSVSCDA